MRRSGAMRATPLRNRWLVPRHAHVVLAGHRHAVVQQQPGADVGPLPRVVQRVEEGHRPDQVRSEPGEQQPALLERLAHQPEVEHLQVAQPAVDQLAAARAGAGGEVALLDQAGGQAARGGVEGGAGADDAAADDEDVELAVAARGGQGAQRGLACRGLSALAWVTAPSSPGIRDHPPAPVTLRTDTGGPIRTYAGIGLVTSLILAVTALGTPGRWSRRAVDRSRDRGDQLGWFRDRR